MTAFYKVIDDDYIAGIGTNGPDGVEEISEQEYRQIETIILTAPEAPVGFVYRLRAADLEWELVEIPDPDPEAEISDYEQELAELGVRFE